MKRLIFFVLGFVLAAALVINMGCVTVQKQRDPLGIMNNLEKELAKEQKCNSVTLRNKTPFDVDYVIVRYGPNLAPFYIDKNLRYRGWIKAHGEMPIKDVPIGTYWAVFRLGPKIVHLQYNVDLKKPTVINLTYNAKKVWANYGEPR